MRGFVRECRLSGGPGAENRDIRGCCTRLIGVALLLLAVAWLTWQGGNGVSRTSAVQFVKSDALRHPGDRSSIPTMTEEVTDIATQKCLQTFGEGYHEFTQCIKMAMTQETNKKQAEQNSSLSAEADEGPLWFSIAPACNVNDTTRWCLDALSPPEMPKERYFWPPQRPLLRRTWAGVQRCLEGKHLVFIGDSRTRYQYVALAYFLTHKVWPVCNEGPLVRKDDSTCSFISEAHYLGLRSLSEIPGIIPGWVSYYKHSNKGLNSNATRSIELCDCIRLEGATRDDLWAEKVSENRFFRQWTVRGRKIQLTYIEYFVDNGSRVNYGFPPWNDDPAKVPCQPGECATDRLPPKSSIILRMEDYLHLYVPQLKPTHVLVAGGWWDKDVGCLLQQFKYANPGVEAWGLINPRKKSVTVRDSAGRWAAPPSLALGCGMKRIDRFEMSLYFPDYLYWPNDDWHFFAGPNEEFNHFLMDAICSSEP